MATYACIIVGPAPDVRLAWQVARWPAIARHAQCVVILTDEMIGVDKFVQNVPRANTNLTCIMIGERVTDWQRGQ